MRTGGGLEMRIAGVFEMQTSCGIHAYAQSMLIFENFSMIVTNENHELPSFPFMLDFGTRAWRVANLEMGIPYVSVSFSCRQGNAWLSQTSILWRDEDVLNYCLDIQADSSRKILEIALLYPPSPKTTLAWKFISVGEIWTVQVSNFDQRSLIYLDSDGNRISTTLAPRDLAKANLEKLEYSKKI